MNKLIVGLGNPGLEYELTRHNIAWLALDGLTFSDDLIWKDKFKGIYSTKNIFSDNIYVLKPMTYMNLSGQSVVSLVNFFKVDLENILVIHDEVDLPEGVITFKKGGGLAGHNGLKSIASSLGSQDFMRLRIGIGRPTRGSMSSWVLKKYNDNELVNVEKIIEGVASAIDLFIGKGFEKAASSFSRRNLIE